ncbi:glucans biosynthesis glucosyltransferase MdoH [Sediminicoccus sp. KRV36]|uniref:glucans biosynthesis glucosyltransferase MdoH n=1 Tax=Sediminicoccus sp. KRV36 TaxID=3133721 RepID=UPI00200CCB9A|nr:glucans biosynthesis glucosyltransferase MdoH [Sediminicoccus rosea]UPY38073.1 glucans biosynthesis glucosyltransferase MdoH [Sediminicoccus rosea]
MRYRPIAVLGLGALIWGAMLLASTIPTPPLVEALFIPEGLFLACLALLSPWIALASVNALLGWVVLIFAPDPPAHVVPALRGLRLDAPTPEGRTAIAVCLRNEEMAPILAALGPLLDGLPASHFSLWFLSDTQDPAFRAAEDAAIAAFRPEEAARIHLRRRADNAGFKAGNVMEFLEAEGAAYDYLLCLDADSEMTPAAVRKLAFALDAAPRIAILQQLIVGRPVAAAFPRLFQFGMRAGMRAWATGQGWWQGPKGPYWGHNALIRIAPFREHGKLETLPDGATILSHDQVEAIRLHGAGWEVWCLPEEAGSLEGNPPALPEFMARDLRWAAGNMQYLALLRRPGLSAMARFQLLQAILMFLCAPFWVLAFMLAALLAALGRFDEMSAAHLAAIMALFWVTQHSPKLAGYAQVLMQGSQAARYGGRGVFARGALLEILFTTILSPISCLNKSRFLLALPFGARMGWGAQNRAARDVGWADAGRLLWFHTLAGALAFGFLAVTAPWAIWFALPWAGGLLLAIPFCVLTASPAFARFLTARGLAATPEEVEAMAG